MRSKMLGFLKISVLLKENMIFPRGQNKITTKRGKYKSTRQYVEKSEVVKSVNILIFVISLAKLNMESAFQNTISLLNILETFLISPFLHFLIEQLKLNKFTIEFLTVRLASKGKKTFFRRRKMKPKNLEK